MLLRHPALPLALAALGCHDIHEDHHGEVDDRADKDSCCRREQLITQITMIIHRMMMHGMTYFQFPRRQVTFTSGCLFLMCPAWDLNSALLCAPGAIRTHVLSFKGRRLDQAQLPERAGRS
jgi:hypothetical protein